MLRLKFLLMTNPIIKGKRSFRPNAFESFYVFYFYFQKLFLITVAGLFCQRQLSRDNFSFMLMFSSRTLLRDLAMSSHRYFTDLAIWAKQPHNRLLNHIHSPQPVSTETSTNLEASNWNHVQYLFHKAIAACPLSIWTVFAASGMSYKLFLTFTNSLGFSFSMSKMSSLSPQISIRCVVSHSAFCFPPCVIPPPL